MKSQAHKQHLDCSLMVSCDSHCGKPIHNAAARRLEVEMGMSCYALATKELNEVKLCLSCFANE